MDTANRIKTARLRIGNKFSAGSKRFFISSTASTPTLEPTQAPMDTGVNYPGPKRPGRKAHHTPPPDAKVKHAWSCCRSVSPHADMECCLNNRGTDFPSSFWHTYNTKQPELLKSGRQISELCMKCAMIHKIYVTNYVTVLYNSNVFII